MTKIFVIIAKFMKITKIFDHGNLEPYDKSKKQLLHYKLSTRIQGWEASQNFDMADHA